jgi:predicted nucleic acid-binding protein
MTQILISIDSNILIYSEGINDPQREALARDCLASLPSTGLGIAVQALGEFYRVLVRKAMHPPQIAGQIVRQFEQFATPMPTTVTAFSDALNLVSQHNLQIWDAIILAVSAEHGCKCLLSEDMQDGFVWRGVEIINPLTPSGAKRLQTLIQAN